jgi:hypothetical protein
MDRGLTGGEAAGRDPADGLVPHPTTEVAHVITIDAPPDRVRPGLARLGRDRAGTFRKDDRPVAVA